MSGSPRLSPDTRFQPEKSASRQPGTRKTKVRVAIEDLTLRESLLGILAKQPEFETVGKEGMTFPAMEELGAAGPSEKAEIRILSSCGEAVEDLLRIRKTREETPHVRILFLGDAKGEAEFLQYVRAGVGGYLPRTSSAAEVLAGIRAVRDGQAVCPGTECALLFRYIEQEAEIFPSAAIQRSLGLTRREQQLVPLVAKGFTNKEIANYFCLSEQTVKNHLYRMKQKIGAGDRLGIVQACRTHGLVV